jgi:hypothetical protein
MYIIFVISEGYFIFNKYFSRRLKVEDILIPEPAILQWSVNRLALFNQAEWNVFHLENGPVYNCISTVNVAVAGLALWIGEFWMLVGSSSMHSETRLCRPPPYLAMLRMQPLSWTAWKRPIMIFLSPVLSVSHPSWLEEHDPDSFGILFYARSRASVNLAEAGSSGTP